MTLTPGARFGAFEIVGILGRGGMGEVYRAQDSALGREVAIKILPEAFASDPDRSARFALEARVLASLNHPNIGAIYGVEEREGVRALVLELVEGPTLADRIEQESASAGKPVGLPLEEVLSIAEQIAAAFETAHEQGVIHRDLKPANVKLRPDGTVKVLDFGLAKLASSGLASAAGSTQLPTMTSPALMTQHGVILGTAGYMSPEQARGKVADKRSDVWSFGCVLYETLTGRRAFPGDELADTLAAILRADPEWSALPPDTPPSIRRLLERSLRKDPRERLPEIGSARLEIADARRGVDGAISADAHGAQATERPRWPLAMIGGLVVAAALGAAALKLLLPVPPSPRETHLEIATPPTVDPVSFALSPDGRSLTFVASVDRRSQLWLRSLDTGEQRPLRGTEGASYPFWSPDSRSIGFFASQLLERVDIEGGALHDLARAPVGAGGAWNEDGVILFTPVGEMPVVRISADGDSPLVLANGPNLLAGQRFPRFLPDGNRFLYHVLEPSARGVYLGALDRPERTRLFEADSAAVYADGDLLFARGGTLYAQRFDPDAARLVGSPRVLAEGIAVDARGAPALSASRAGSIAYRTGSAVKERRLVWVDRSGAEVAPPYPADSANPRSIALSPDGRRVALNRSVEGNSDIWIYDLDRRVPTRVTFDPASDLFPAWSTDGRRILYSRATPEGFKIFAKSVDGSEEEELISSPDFPPALVVSDWSADGRLLCTTIGTVGSAERREMADVVVVSIHGGSPAFLARTDFDERSGTFSPDGRWVTYVSNGSGRFEVFVQRSGGSGRRLQVSPGGGVQPEWRPDGRELYYIAPDRQLMAVAVREREDGEKLEIEAPVPLFVAPVAASMEGGAGGDYAASPDGNRFLLNTQIEQSGTPIQIILNRSQKRRDE